MLNLFTSFLDNVYRHLSFFFDFAFYTLLPRSLSRRFLPLHDHFAAHQHARFEGYYTRIQTTDKSTIIIILSSVPDAANGTSHFIHFSVSPSKHSPLQHVRVDLFPQELKYGALKSPRRDGRQSFRVQADNYGSYTVDHDTQMYRLLLPDPERVDETLHISIDITNRTPLNAFQPLYTPHGSVVRLGSLLPLHWHIFSTQSTAAFVVKRGETVIAQGEGLAHLEKNWGRGFPDSWTWMQAFSSPTQPSAESLPLLPRTSVTTLSLAGGNILGAKAYMVVYRSPSLQWDFAVPWTLLFLIGKGAWSPFTSESIRSESCGVDLDVSTFTRRLVVRAQGSMDLDEWLPLDCPLFDGHGNVTARETFSARIVVEAYSRSIWKLWAGWRKLECQVFEDAAFELGGDYRSISMLKADKKLAKLQ